MERGEEGQPLSRGKTIKQPRGEITSVKRAAGPVLRHQYVIDVLCKDSFSRGVAIRPRQRRVGRWKEGGGELTSSLTPNLVKKIFNVIEVKEIEQRSDLLHFSWVSLIANKIFNTN